MNRVNIKEIDIKKYFEQLSGSKLTNAVGDYKIQFTASNEQREISALIEFSNGVVVYHANTSSKDVDLSMSCPGAIVQNIITNNLSWDEIFFLACLTLFIVFCLVSSFFQIIRNL